MNGRYLGLILVAIAIFPTTIYLKSGNAQVAPQLLSQKVNCSNPQTTIEINQCTRREADAADRQLNQVYQQLKPKISRQQQQKLIQAQQAWIKFKDATCAYEQAQFEGGTISTSVYFNCLTQVTQQRTKDLQRYLQQP